DKSLKRPARRPGAEEKFFCPGTRFAVIPLIIDVIQIPFELRCPDFITSDGETKNTTTRKNNSVSRPKYNLFAVLRLCVEMFALRSSALEPFRGQKVSWKFEKIKTPWKPRGFVV
ncbi:MAG: hypothetical protein B5M55_02565, partial [Desulfococcus sp. 4484_242]